MIWLFGLFSCREFCLPTTKAHCWAFAVFVFQFHHIRSHPASHDLHCFAFILHAHANSRTSYACCFGGVFFGNLNSPELSFFFPLLLVRSFRLPFAEQKRVMVFPGFLPGAPLSRERGRSEHGAGARIVFRLSRAELPAATDLAVRPCVRQIRLHTRKPNSPLPCPGKPGYTRRTVRAVRMCWCVPVRASERARECDLPTFVLVCVLAGGAVRSLRSWVS